MNGLEGGGSSGRFVERVFKVKADVFEGMKRWLETCRKIEL